MEEVKCYMPQTLAEALQIRKETGAQPLAGGSDLMVANSRGAGIVPGFKNTHYSVSGLFLCRLELKSQLFEFCKYFL